ncbi:MAG: YceI family protein [Bacteroidia bacterium]
MTKKIIITIICALLLVNLSLAQNGLKIISSKISFKIKNAGLSVDGTFSGFEGEINFIPEQYKTATIKASINTNTINTGINARDKHLKKEEFFDVNKFPKIAMVSSFFGKDGNNFLGYFKLTIKGITKDVKIPFTFENNILKGDFTLNRLDYNIGRKSFMMNDNVSISIVLNTIKN